MNNGGLDPIDKILIRTGITILGTIFGWSAIQSKGSLDEIAQAVKTSKAQHAGVGPALPVKENK